MQQMNQYRIVHSKFRITNQSDIKIPMKSDMKDALVLGNKLLFQGRGQVFKSRGSDIDRLSTSFLLLNQQMIKINKFKGVRGYNTPAWTPHPLSMALLLKHFSFHGIRVSPILTFHYKKCRNKRQFDLTHVFKWRLNHMEASNIKEAPGLRQDHVFMGKNLFLIFFTLQCPHKKVARYKSENFCLKVCKVFLGRG